MVASTAPKFDRRTASITSRSIFGNIVLKSDMACANSNCIVEAIVDQSFTIARAHQNLIRNRHFTTTADAIEISARVIKVKIRLTLPREMYSISSIFTYTDLLLVFIVSGSL